MGYFFVANAADRDSLVCLQGGDLEALCRVRGHPCRLLQRSDRFTRPLLTAKGDEPGRVDADEQCEHR